MKYVSMYTLVCVSVCYRKYVYVGAYKQIVVLKINKQNNKANIKHIIHAEVGAIANLTSGTYVYDIWTRVHRNAIIVIFVTLLYSIYVDIFFIKFFLNSRI